MNSNLLAALAKQGIYDLTALATIGACGVAHLISAFNSTALFQATMPVFGITACIAYGLICFASKKGSLLKLLFVVGALTTFWIQ